MGISGGADSVALAALARGRCDLHLVHLNYELRGAESDADQELVRSLADQWKLPLTVARRSTLEPQQVSLPANLQARYRVLRMQLFADVVRQHQLEGVLLAHHADDQAETILLRLVRGAGVQGLAGMRRDTVVDGLRICRPLLGIGREALRHYLREQAIPWREDASNAAGEYLRNRLRDHLRERPQLTGALLRLGESAAALRDWMEGASLPVGPELAVAELEGVPRILLRDLLRRWLLEAGISANDLSIDLLERLVEMAWDAATPPRLNLPGGRHVARRHGRLSFLPRPAQ